MKPADVQLDTYIAYAVEHNHKILKLKVDDRVKMSKYESIFGECQFSKLVRGRLCDQESKKYCTMDKSC